MKRLTLIVAGLLTGMLLLSDAQAGTFQMEQVWYESQLSADGSALRVMVGARAGYVGPVDPGDRHWSIQTHLTHNGSTRSGTPVTGSGITQNMNVTVQAGQHGAFKDILTCTAFGNSSSYRGQGVVGIYHQYNPESSTQNGSWENTECVSGGGSGGGEGGDTEPDDPGDAPGDPPGLYSPIVIDMDRGGFRFTDLESGVNFDIDADGLHERVAWIADGSGDAFLALDRNGNQAIDDGSELFGDSTQQPSSDHPNGFSALAVFDQAGNGGNDDGWISSADSVFEDLVLWVDSDHDGSSSQRELKSLAEHGVVAISLRPTESRRRDRHGNLLRYKSVVQLNRATTQAVDVFLLAR